MAKNRAKSVSSLTRVGVDVSELEFRVASALPVRQIEEIYSRFTKSESIAKHTGAKKNQIWK